MTQEELMYKILQDSNYIRVPEHESKIQNFLDQIKECPFEFPETDIEKRQFETILKSWFEQYTAELIEFAKENPATFRNREAELDFVNFMTIDDQGFNGQVMEYGHFYRIIQDTIDTQKNLDCDFITSEAGVLTCVEQAKMFQLGYVMDYNHEWFKPTKDDEIGGKIMSASVDWVHLHNGEKCAKVRKFYEGGKNDFS